MLKCEVIGLLEGKAARQKRTCGAKCRLTLTASACTNACKSVLLDVGLNLGVCMLSFEVTYLKKIK